MDSFNLKEVCEIVGVPPHVISYWETEFLLFKPKRDELRQRIYSQKDLKIIISIRCLLFEGKYSIADTKIKLAEEFG